MIRFKGLKISLMYKFYFYLQKEADVLKIITVYPKNKKKIKKKI